MTPAEREQAAVRLAVIAMSAQTGRLDDDRLLDAIMPICRRCEWRHYPIVDCRWTTIR